MLQSIEPTLDDKQLNKQQQPVDLPLVSVIVPCYNHGKYLRYAINSIWQQQYPNIEIIVVDDGSIDNTRVVAANLDGVTYVYQENQGLSAARNLGVKHAKGEFFVFLDADDWLLPKAIEINATYLLKDKQLAFVSGAHVKVYVGAGLIKEEKWDIHANHFEQLLQGNYIGMHAAVMYRRWVFQEVEFDVGLRSCEDYDLYLKIARKHPVKHHVQKIAAYRLHDTNMSGNIPRMLASVLLVLDRQQDQLVLVSERHALVKGKQIWKEYYCRELYKKIANGKEPLSFNAFLQFFRYKPSLFFKLKMIKSIIKKNAPNFGLKWLHRMGLTKKYTPKVGSVTPRDFDRLTPFSRDFGYDRGGAIDRYYIENFLQGEATCIKGRVLEIGDNEYTMKFGGGKVSKSDIFHVNDENPQATLIGDISNAPQIPDNTFDCIILTQTLHLIYDFKGALATCHRILKPGGALLLTVPYITSIAKDEWGATWYWSFTDKVLRLLMAETFPGGKAEVGSFGNVLVASAFLYGMGRTEISQKELDHYDPQYQVINTVKAIKL
ncbi:glycosyltransferase [Pontibacter beigongshangensis]|uniref:glycosyltransferase n=1 Tax=Pontibacter beigongshangensis TaxID=2574733 RepID=UPI0016501218|nr:glycosyltransferase [Pontibacter beigongshangensis]